MTSAGTSSSAAEDVQLGQRIGHLLAACPDQRGHDPALLAHVQDLLGADSSLLLPIRDLLTRPSLRILMRADSLQQRLIGRDGLLADLLLTYQPAVVERLGRLLDGILQLPPVVLPVDHEPQRSGATERGSVPGPAALQGGSADAPTGSGPLLPLLILVGSLALGVAVVVVAWLLLSARQSVRPVPATATSGQGTSPSLQDASPTPPSVLTFRRQVSDDGGTAWADAASYKHGILPSREFPQTCAFSRSDAQGASVTELGRMEFWACRDQGGDPARGVVIRWSDGQETTYRFTPEGGGSITGTEGETYPIRWRNRDYQGHPIIVIEHRDRGESWIPGRLDGSGG